MWKRIKERIGKRAFATPALGRIAARRLLPCVLGGALCVLIVSCLICLKGEEILSSLSRVCDPLRDTIEEDPSYRDGKFYIYDRKDYQRFNGYLNREWERWNAADGNARDNVKRPLPCLETPAVLMADLDMRTDRGYRGVRLGKFIKKNIARYNGEFDGNGHTIVWHENARYGMFLVLDRKARVHDLKLEGEIRDQDAYTRELVASGAGLGLFCLRNYGTIENCGTDGYLEGYCAVGGIAGQNYGIIRGCVNRARVVCLAAGEYGAGGIAGVSMLWDGESEALIEDCVNYGGIKGPYLAGGICAQIEDMQSRIIGCGNEGAVCALYRQAQPYRDDPAYAGGEDAEIRERWEVSGAGGIAGKMNAGYLEKCYNTGTVTILEEGAGGVYAIAGGAFGNSELRNCVSLAGAAQGHMRHENIMELSREEMERWKADPDSAAYVYNNWQFDLKEAAEKLNLSPLGLEESEMTKGRDDAYLCGDFCLRAPEGFAVRRVSDYALCMEADAAADLLELERLYGSGAGGYQLWVLRLPAREEEEMNGFLERLESLDTAYAWGQEVTRDRAAASDNRLKLAVAFSIADIDVETDVSHIWSYVDGLDWLHPLDFSNSFDHHTWRGAGKGLSCRSFNYYKEEMNAVWYTYVKGDETGKLRLDNIVSLPVKEDFTGKRSVRYLLLFTNRENNYRPELSFAQTVMEDCFRYLPCEVRVQRGETLSELARRYTGDWLACRELAAYNGIENADKVRAGRILRLPEKWLLMEDWLAEGR